MTEPVTNKPSPSSDSPDGEVVSLPLYPQSSGSKRQRSQSRSACVSSDIPVFSSDDLENADLHNYYHSPRQKRMVRGPWWKSPPKSLNYAPPVGSVHTVVPFGRVAATTPEQRDPVALESKTGLPLNATIAHDSFHLPESGTSRFKTCPFITTQELEAARQVEVLVSNHNERVNLSNLSLSILHSSTLEPLSTLICPPPYFDGASTQPTDPHREYHSLSPSIRLFLSNNLLGSLPSTLWNLEHLTFLSLRNNMLTEIPSCVSNLHNLQHLNVAANRLRWLPWELLSMLKVRGGQGKLEELILTPNPFVSPSMLTGGDLDYPCPIAVRSYFVSQSLKGQRTDHVLANRFAAHELCFNLGFVASSEISYCGFDGAPEIGSWEDKYVSSPVGLHHPRKEHEFNSVVVPPVLHEWELPNGTIDFDQGRTFSSSRVRISSVPPLQELALRSLTTLMASVDVFRTSCPPSSFEDIMLALGIDGSNMPARIAQAMVQCANIAAELAAFGRGQGHGLAALSKSGSSLTENGGLLSQSKSRPCTSPNFLRSQYRAQYRPAERISSRCTSCQSPYILHRASWIEYWTMQTGINPDLTRVGNDTERGVISATTSHQLLHVPPEGSFHQPATAFQRSRFQWHGQTEAIQCIYPFIRKACTSACVHVPVIDGWDQTAHDAVINTLHNLQSRDPAGPLVDFPP